MKRSVLTRRERSRDGQSPAPLVNQTRHERGPSGLVRCAQSLSGVPVEVFEEPDQILPMRVVGEDLGLAFAAGAVRGAVAVGVWEEDVGHAAGKIGSEAGEGGRVRR